MAGTRDTATSFESSPGEANIQKWHGAEPAIVLLHDGLGSVSQWRDVPAQLNKTTGSMVVAYNRPGHGAAGPRPTGPWPVTWMHEQADSLKRLVQALNIERPLIVGHSDGASIALIAAARGLDTVGVLALAPHSFVEPVCVEEISAMRGNRHRIVSALRRHHQHPEALFDAWSGVWTSKDFAMWDIRPELAAIATPCVVVQGDRDEYATDQQLANTVAAINSSPDRTWARAVVWADTGHLVHHDAPERIVMYVQSLLAAAPDR